MPDVSSRTPWSALYVTAFGAALGALLDHALLGLTIVLGVQLLISWVAQIGQAQAQRAELEELSALASKITDEQSAPLTRNLPRTG